MNIIYVVSVLINFYETANALQPYQTNNADIFEGDMVLRPNQIQPVEFAEITSMSVSVPWPTNKIYYRIGKRVTAKIREIVDKAMREIEKKTCVRFIPKQENQQIQHYIFIAYLQNGCQSAVGYDENIKKFWLRLSDQCSLNNALHGFLHILGFWHEYSRWDRDNYMDIIQENIPKESEKNFVKRLDTISYPLNIKFDFKSTLLLPYNAFSIDRRKPTMIPGDIDTIIHMGQRHHLSEQDNLKINRLYKCNSQEDYGNNNIQASLRNHNLRRRNHNLRQRHKLRRRNHNLHQYKRN